MRTKEEIYKQLDEFQTGVTERGGNIQAGEMDGFILEVLLDIRDQLAQLNTIRK